MMDTLEHEHEQVKTLDLFCGAGLASSGAARAGATLVGAIDMDGVATSTYQANFESAHVLTKRLETVSPATLKRKLGDIDLLLASPECTNHTCAKGSAPRNESSRETAMQVLRFAKVFRPRWIAMENVVHMRPWARYAELLSELRKLKYNIREQVLDASVFGVPQRRRRLFVMCDLMRDPPKVTPPAGLKQQTVRDILDVGTPWRTSPLFTRARAKDTIARAKRAFAALGEEQPFLLVYYGSDAAGGWQSIDRPLRTVTTIDRFALVTPTANGHTMRMLQVPELQRAMGVRASHKLPVGTRREKIRLLGNGVCPPVMRAVVSTLTG
jgi:DNA (cytosine-5)-methyltransferase 1